MNEGTRAVITEKTNKVFSEFFRSQVKEDGAHKVYYFDGEMAVVTTTKGIFTIFDADSKKYPDAISKITNWVSYRADYWNGKKPSYLSTSAKRIITGRLHEFIIVLQTFSGIKNKVIWPLQATTCKIGYVKECEKALEDIRALKKFIQIFQRSIEDNDYYKILKVMFVIWTKIYLGSSDQKGNKTFYRLGLELLESNKSIIDCLRNGDQEMINILTCVREKHQLVYDCILIKQVVPDHNTISLAPQQFNFETYNPSLNESTDMLISMYAVLGFLKMIQK